MVMMAGIVAMAMPLQPEAQHRQAGAGSAMK